MWTKYQTYKGLVTWDIATIGHIAILGMPWLKQANPTINWEDGTVQIDTKPAGQRHKVSALAELTIPAEYAEFEAMFTKPAIEDALPKHQPWDHEIPLMPGKNPKKQPIYAITP
ncbi:pol protein [Lasallia pustulata]|uniref:Pol protein n=1 Tax=Lasallia pustulata TaxID=136370 RepID=A0A1W5D8P2_9LECA|nr:pol protein [Lasallia pustulata]